MMGSGRDPLHRWKGAAGCFVPRRAWRLKSERARGARLGPRLGLWDRGVSWDISPGEELYREENSADHVALDGLGRVSAERPFAICMVHRVVVTRAEHFLREVCSVSRVRYDCSVVSSPKS